MLCCMMYDVCMIHINSVRVVLGQYRIAFKYRVLHLKTAGQAQAQSAQAMPLAQYTYY